MALLQKNNTQKKTRFQNVNMTLLIILTTRLIQLINFKMFNFKEDIARIAIKIVNCIQNKESNKIRNTFEPQSPNSNQVS